MNQALLSSSNTSWYTPKELYDWLDRRFCFTLDPCATKETALCKKFYTIVDDGLSKDWTGERVFMNPPYGRDIWKWAKKAYHEAQAGALVVGLVPSRTDTEWWQKYVLNKAHVLYIKGRLKFGSAKQSAPFPSALCIWWGADQLGSW